MERLKPFINGHFVESKATKYTPIYDPSTGEQIAETSCCTREEVESAVNAAQAAFSAWSETPCARRVEVLYRFRDLLLRDMDQLTHCVCR